MLFIVRIQIYFFLDEISIVVLFSSFMRSTITELKKDLFH